MGLEPTLGEFSCPTDDVGTPGLLSVTDGRVHLELHGCMEVDRLSSDPKAGGFPRTIPAEGDHEVVTGFLRSGVPVTLLGVQGHAWGPLRMVNGVSWIRPEHHLSGDMVEMYADHAIMNTGGDEEPRFDKVVFEMGRLAELLDRTRVWNPTAEVDALRGYVPLVIVPVDNFRFEVGELQIDLQQQIRVNQESVLGEVATTEFAFSRESGPIRLSDCLDLLNDLRTLSEFACHAHVPLGAATGWRLPEGMASRIPERYPIHSWLQAQSSHRDSAGQVISLHSLYPSEPQNELEKLQQQIETADPYRAELIQRWLEWVEVANNRDLIVAYLRPFHGSSNPSWQEVFRSTMGVLEDLMDSPAGDPRVAALSELEIQEREQVIQEIQTCFEDDDRAVVAWAVDRLTAGTKGRGLQSKLRELIEQHEAALQPILRAGRPKASASENPKKTARKLTSMRGSLSHGVSSRDASEVFWRSDQLQLIVIGVVLCEMGYEPVIVAKLINGLSRTEGFAFSR